MESYCLIIGLKILQIYISRFILLFIINYYIEVYVKPEIVSTKSSKMILFLVFFNKRMYFSNDVLIIFHVYLSSSFMLVLDVIAKKYFLIETYLVAIFYVGISFKYNCNLIHVIFCFFLIGLFSPTNNTFIINNNPHYFSHCST